MMIITVSMYGQKRLFSVLCTLCLSFSCYVGQPVRRLDLPSVVLWAWERPENFSFLNPRDTGVAFLAGTAAIATDGSVRFRLRTQNLMLPPGTAVLPVVRIESPPVHAPVKATPLFAGLEKVANLPGGRGLQIDFDARRSERAFYRTLLASLHKQTSRPITVTALASWCEGDRWLDREPVMEAVPMFFRMGRGESRGMKLNSPVCLSSIGLSTDEPWPDRRPTGIERVYLFSPRAWTQGEYKSALQRLQRWK